MSDVHLLAEVDDFPADNLKLLSYMPMNLQKITLIDEPVEGKWECEMTETAKSIYFHEPVKEPEKREMVTTTTPPKISEETWWPLPNFVFKLLVLDHWDFGAEVEIECVLDILTDGL